MAEPDLCSARSEIAVRAHTGSGDFSLRALAPGVLLRCRQNLICDAAEIAVIHAIGRKFEANNHTALTLMQFVGRSVHHQKAGAFQSI